MTILKRSILAKAFPPPHTHAYTLTYEGFPIMKI